MNIGLLSGGWNGTCTYVGEEFDMGELVVWGGRLEHNHLLVLLVHLRVLGLEEHQFVVWNNIIIGVRASNLWEIAIKGSRSTSTNILQGVVYGELRSSGNKINMCFGISVMK